MNLRLLLTSIAVVAAAAIGVFLLREHRQVQLVGYIGQRADVLIGEEDWQAASFYLTRYLQLNPSDYDARLKLIDVTRETAEGRAQRDFLIRLLYETIGLAPTDAQAQVQRLRSLLAEELLENGDFNAAFDATQEALKAKDKEVLARAKRVAALAKLRLASLEGAASPTEKREAITDALRLLLAALSDRPGDVTLASATATVCQEFPLAAGALGKNAAELADAVMNRLVAERPDDPEPLIARYRYRKRGHDDEGALADLQSAYTAAPDHFEANVLLGVESLADGTPESNDAARRFFRTAINARPDNATAYRLLAQLEWNSGNREEALAILEEAQRELPATMVDARLMRADYLITLGRTKEANEALVAVRQQVGSQLVAAEQLNEINRAICLLEAKVDAANGDLKGALNLYSAVSSSSGSEAAPQTTAMNREASQGAAEVFKAVGHWDMAAQELSRLAAALHEEIAGVTESSRSNPQVVASYKAMRDEHTRVRVQAAEAYLRAGQPAEAIGQIDVLVDDSSSGGGRELPPLAAGARLWAELMLQLDRPPNARHWEEFKFLLKRAQKILPDSERVVHARLYQRIASEASGEKLSQELQSEIESASERFAASPSFWRLASDLYIRIGETSKAEAATRRFLDLVDDRERRARAWVEFLVNAGRIAEARDWLEEQISAAEAESKPRLEILEVQVLAQQGRGEQALRKALALAKNSTDRQTLSVTLELALAQGDWKAAEALENRLADVQTFTDSDVEYFRAFRLISNYSELSRSERNELTRLVSKLRTDRPNWWRGAVLEAQLAEAAGDAEKAIEAYGAAVGLGDRRPVTLERLSLLLFRTGQYDRAQDIIKQLRTRPGAVSQGTESLAISTAVKQQDLSEALRLARKAVAEHPDDAARRLWLYHVLRLDEEDEEAELALSAARDDFPESELIWDAQFGHLVRTNRQDAARLLLQDLPPAFKENDFKKNVAMARGHELLGEFVKARQYYQESIRLRPEETGVRLRYATVLLYSDPAAAREQLEEVLRRQPDNADARRKLSALLAGTGEPSAWDRIDELLGSDQGGDDVQDRRLRAILLARRGRSIEERAAHCELARRILFGIVESSDHAPADIDRLLLAGAYEQEGLLKNDPAFLELARSQLRLLLERPNGEEAYGDLYLSFLLRSTDLLADMTDAATIRDAFISDARKRINDRSRAVSNSAPGTAPLEKLNVAGLQVRLLRAEGKSPEAIRTLNDIAEQEISSEVEDEVRARLLLGLGGLYSTLGEHERAENCYRELMKFAPGARLLLSQSLLQQGKTADAVSLFLADSADGLSPKHAMTIAGLLSMSDDPSSAFEQAWPAVAGALKQHQDDVELLLSVAVLQVTRGNQDEAIKHFRRILELDPDHTLALNNLATLLGERPDTRSEALELISHAIRVAGREPALLDTRGTIQLHLGDAEAAISSLEESVAGVNVDPRYYFHLAAAYLHGGQRANALEALEEARKRGIDKSVLTTADRELITELEAGLGNARTALKDAS